MSSQFLTCSFKLHDPNRWQRDILDFVFTEYTLAMRDLLAWTQENSDAIQQGAVSPKGKYKADAVAKMLPSSGEVKLGIASCLREALLGDISSMLASYYALQGVMESVGYPVARDPSPEGLEWAEYELSLVGADLADYEQSKANVTRRARGSVMPINIARSRDFAILTDAEHSRFFVCLKVLPGGSSLGKKIQTQGNLTDIQTGEVFNYSGSSAILVPLEMGIRREEWHWQYEAFILPTIQGSVAIKSAKLIRHDGTASEKAEYFINIAFEFECPPVYEHQGYLGIDRGILFTMAYAVVDKQGGVVIKGHYEDGLRALQMDAGKQIQRKQQRGRQVTIKDYRRKQQEELLHKLANRVIALAKEHGASVVIEDLNIQVRAKFVRSAWTKLEGYLRYKCVLAGVPFYGTVFAAKTSQICIHCGEIVERNDRAVTCHHCGQVEHSDDAAAVNIARRALYRKKEWEKKGGYIGFHKSFSRCQLVTS